MPSQSTPKIRALLVVCVFGFLAGCGDMLKQPYPAKNYFGIDARQSKSAVPLATTSAAQPDHGPVLLVRGVRVVAPFDGIAFVYQTGASQYVTDYYANWVASPAALLTADLDDWLSAASSFVAVAPDSAAHHDYVLETTVTRLLIDRTHAAQPVADLAAHFIVTRELADGTKIILDTEDSAQVPAASDSPSAYASALGDAYRAILDRLQTKLSSTIHSQ